MGNQQQGILTSVLGDQGSVFPDNLLENGAATTNANVRVGNRKNAKAASQARARGATTNIEKSMQGLLDDQQVLIEKQGQLRQAEKGQNSVNTLLDKIGQLPPEEMFSNQAFQNTKQLLPALTREKYMNDLAPNAARRRLLTKQLESLPMGTPLPPQTLAQLKDAGITDPNKYMSLSVLAPAGTLQGEVQRTAVARAEQGSGSLLAPLGASLRREQAGIDRATAEFASENLASAQAQTKALQAQIAGGKPLTTNQKFQAGRSLRNDIRKDFKRVNTQFEFFKNIQSFSDPNQGVTTFRLEGSDSLKGGVKKVTAGKTFQNINDIALLYSFIKMLDPESVVREGEVKLTDKSKPFLAGLGLKAEAIFTGESLTDDQRIGILNVANRSLISSTQGLGTIIELIENNIDQFGLTRNTIIDKRTENSIETFKRLKAAQEQIDVEQRVPSQADQGQPPQTGNVGDIQFEILPD